MLIFIALILVVATLGVIYSSQKRAIAYETVKLEKLNAEIYQQRIAEIRASQAGNQKELEAELARTLIEESKQGTSSKKLHKASPLVALVVVLVICLTYFVTPQHKSNALAQEQLAPYQEDARNYLGGDDSVLQGLKNEEIRFLVSAIQLQLSTSKSDSHWRRYGQLLFKLEETKLANLAYERAYLINPENVANMEAHAQAQLTLANGKLNKDIQQLFDSILEKDPTSERTLLMYGFAAYNAGAFPLAVEKWQALLEYKEPGSKAYNMVANSIQAAKNQLKSVAQPSTNTSNTGTTPNQASGNLPGVSLEVAIDASVASNLEPNDTLFVFAKAIQGPQMPIAVYKTKAPTFPVSVRLTDNNRMMDQFKISQYSQVKVSAFISKSGTVSKRAGDMIADEVVLAVNNQSKPIKLTINQVIN